VEKRRRAINASLISKLSQYGCKILSDEPLSKHTSFNIGGNADFFVEIPNQEALAAFLKLKLPFFVLGGGTNILFSDAGYRGIIIKLTGDFTDIFVEDNEVICGAGANLARVLKTAAQNSLSGLENAAGIPGNIGGAVFGNAGTNAQGIGACLKYAEVFKHGQREVINKEDIRFSYRSSSLENCLITKVVFALKKADKNDILNAISIHLDKRVKSQPLSSPNAGCIFKNPTGLSAGKLIDEAGLKGLVCGGAKISEIHANFIVNTGGAKSKDVVFLMETVTKAVKEKFNIVLEPEIRIF
jgi:UDP-N-acetylmuramate dehydrogenase